MAMALRRCVIRMRRQSRRIRSAVISEIRSLRHWFDYTSRPFTRTHLRNERSAVEYRGREWRQDSGWWRMSGSRQRDRGAVGWGWRHSTRPSRIFSLARLRGPRPFHRSRERAESRPAGARQGAASRQGHWSHAGHCQAGPALTQCGVPFGPAR